MQLDRVESGLFTPENFKCVEVYNFPSTPSQEKNFMNGLQNVRQLLEGLERSLAKTSKYEDQLLRCKSTHAHSHAYWWDSDRSEKESKCSKSGTYDLVGIKPRSQVNLAESWSTMSIVCLQYQYEELSKRYESLLRAYHDRCAVVRERDGALGRLRARTKDAHSQLAHAHRTLIAVGDKYLELCRKKRTQKNKYEDRIKHLKATVRGVMAMCEHARLQLDTTIARYLETEGEAPNAQLLAEIRKCNLLFLENLRLKAQIEKLTPGEAFSEKR
ncbi:hypothetical protein ABMA28_004467 [Loxostege sticticalis]|uniref:Uncharacterized protein n=1 Tax=Loxostege sticticalis TaxID=481309 RepID=A0ABD0SR98_LOXSC